MNIKRHHIVVVTALSLGVSALFVFRSQPSAVDLWLRDPSLSLTTLRSNHGVFVTAWNALASERLEAPNVVVVYDRVRREIVGVPDVANVKDFERSRFLMQVARKSGIGRTDLAVYVEKELLIDRLPRDFTGRVWIVEDASGGIGEVVFGRESVLVLFEGGKIVSVDRGQITW